MIHIERFFLKGRIKIIGLTCVWLLISGDANLSAQNQFGDTSSRYPYLWNILDMYCYYNLSGPKNIDELVEFIDIMEPVYSGDFHYKTIREVTIPKLINNSDRIRVVSSDCEYALILGDTLLFDYDIFPCCDFIEDYYPEDQPIIIKKKIEKDIFFFKSKKPIVAEDENLIIPLVKELKTIYKEYSVNKEKIVFLGYLKGNHLFDYCKYNINLGDPYYKRIENLLKDFCIKHDIDKIYLHIYCEDLQ